MMGSNGLRLYQIRSELKMSRREFAEALGVSFHTIRRREASSARGISVPKPLMKSAENLLAAHKGPAAR